MRHQRMRMLATLDLGQPHWSMDTGGFFGHPTDENYARWIEFASFVPIDRVHGDITEHRQPWLFGPVAEAAAKRAIRLRYELMPYIYSSERVATETGIGVVRPLFWQFPDDRRVANDGDAWMFGDALLVSPVMAAGETSHEVYLPVGEWFDYFRGTRFTGGKSIAYPVDAKTWRDIPVFVRDGSIVATQQAADYVDQHPADEIALDVFPGAHRADFVYYDDDGNTYGYEHGAYYRQAIHAAKTQDGAIVDLDKPSGSFHPALRSYVVRIHGIAAHSVQQGKAEMKRSQAAGADAAPSEGEWSTGQDRFGPVTIVRIPSGQESALVIQ
jgi:alpha-glucosidase